MLIVFRAGLLEIWDDSSEFYAYCLSTADERRLQAVAEEESAALQGIRLWRSQHRKKMVDSIERLIEQAVRIATSQYTRSNQRARWTHLAGQLIWYKDQILRGMTWEALEQDVSKTARRVIMRDMREKRQAARPWTPTIVKRKEDEESLEPDEASKETDES